MSRTAVPEGAAPVLPLIDREIARALSARIAEKHRREFAQDFTFAVVDAFWQASGLAQPVAKPEGVPHSRLSPEASSAAKQFGEALTQLDVKEAAYFAGTIYATALPEAYRAAHGIFYTPPALVDQLLSMAEEGGVDWRTARILDPACGGGAFLLPAAQRMAAALEGANPTFVLQQIGARLHGFELDKFAVWLAQIMLEITLRDVIHVARPPLPKMVSTRDSLDLDLADLGSYDLVIGNPPYGRVTPTPERRRRFGRSVYGHANLYGLFIDAALHWVRDGGLVAYVTPASMLSGLYYKALRRVLVSSAPPLAVNFIGERHGVFADVLQETMLAAYRRGGKTRTGTVGFIELNPEGNASLREAGTFSLPARPEAPWLLPRDATQVALTRCLRSMPARLSDYGYGVSTGPLVWNRFKDQLHHERNGNTYPVIWAEAVTSTGRFLWRSEKRNHAPWFAARLPRDAWLIVTKPCVLLQRTTAKEQPRRLIAAEMSAAFISRHKGVVVENHLNMVRSVVPHPRVPAAVIAALLNSATVDTAFRCINGSVAVSAFELQELPLPLPPVMQALAGLVTSGAPVRQQEAVIAAAYAGNDAAAPA